MKMKLVILEFAEYVSIGAIVDALALNVIILPFSGIFASICTNVGYLDMLSVGISTAADPTHHVFLFWWLYFFL